MLKASIDMPTKGGAELFIHAPSGTFGVRGHNSGTEGEFDYMASFCAVIKLPPRSLPPKGVLQSKLGSQKFEKLQESLNNAPHVESGGVATFKHRTDFEAQIHVDGADPVHIEVDGYQNGWLALQLKLDFSSWTQGAGQQVQFDCPQEASTDLAAHPEAKHSLLSLNAITQAMRQHQDLTWLPVDPAAYFTEQLDGMRNAMHDEPQQGIGLEHDNGQWTVVTAVVSFISGGGCVLAMAKFVMAKFVNGPRQMPLLEDA